MASDGKCVFVLEGHSEAASWVDDISLICVFDTGMYVRFVQVENTEQIDPEPEHNDVNPDEKTTQLARKSSAGPPTQEQPKHPKSSPRCTLPLQITHEQKPRFE
jgi:hypothetical protein